MSEIRGRPDDLRHYTDVMVPFVRRVLGEVEDYDLALRAYESAASDRRTDVTSCAAGVRDTLGAVELVDEVPGAFGRALQALDEGSAQDGVAGVSDEAAFEAAVSAALDDPELEGEGLRDAIDRARSDPAWESFASEFVVRGSQVTTGVDAGSQIWKIGSYGINWLDLVRTESLFDNVSRSGMVHRGRQLMTITDALDDAADATYASRLSVATKPTLVDDLLGAAPGAGGGLAKAGKALGWGGVGLGLLDARRDIADGHVTDGTIGMAGAGASAILLLGFGGPVTLGVAATVAVGSVIYENREFIGDVVGGAARGVGNLASEGWGAAGDAARAVSEAVDKVWPW